MNHSSKFFQTFDESQFSYQVNDERLAGFLAVVLVGARQQFQECDEDFGGHVSQEARLSDFRVDARDPEETLALLSVKYPLPVLPAWQCEQIVIVAGQIDFTDLTIVERIGSNLKSEDKRINFVSCNRLQMVKTPRQNVLPLELA